MITPTNLKQVQRRNTCIKTSFDLPDNVFPVEFNKDTETRMGRVFGGW